MNVPSLKEQIAYYIFHQDGYFLVKHDSCEQGNELQYICADDIDMDRSNFIEKLRFHTEEGAIEYAEYLDYEYRKKPFCSFNISEHCIVKKTTIFNICKTLT